MRPPLSPNPIAPYTVFFSHQRRDEAVVRELINIIYSWTENIECFLSENIEKGIDWRNTIAEILTRASVLVMVFTDPDGDWSWVLYETGFFDSSVQVPDGRHSRRIYCLHPPQLFRHRHLPICNPFRQRLTMSWLG